MIETEKTKKDLLSFSFDELEKILLSAGEPRYRAAQIFPQLHRGLSPREMTNVPAKTAAFLEENFNSGLPETVRKLSSRIDGTQKYLFGLRDGNRVETVLMKYRHGNTVCVSSQVGCRMGCVFCASTIGGRVRDLSAGEILGQVIAVRKESGERVDNIVMMGIGEPLDNFDNTLAFLRNVNDSRGINIGFRHVSVSTCGHADGIRRLADEKFPITLSVSLHAHSDAERSAIMPVNKRWGLSELFDACRYWKEKTGRRISFEYTLIKGKNCDRRDAAALATLLVTELRDGEPYPIHVNIIPVNRVKETGLEPPDRKTVMEFCDELERRGVRATVRRTLGPDINASCGQLRRAEAGENG